MTPAAPSQVLSSRLAAPPAAVWAHVRLSGFIADYLGAQLPAAELLPGLQLAGTGHDGRPLAIAVTEALPPSSLTLQLRCGGDAHTALRLSIAACGPGSRLTLVHEAPSPSGAGNQADALTQHLAAAPAATLLAGDLGSAQALAAARAYLADSASAVASLRLQMAPGQGYAQPAGGGFSLVQHLWHLADIEEFGWSQRFERLLAEERAVLPGVDGDRLAIERRYQQRPWRAAATRFVRLRRRTLAALARCGARRLQRPVVFSGEPSSGAEMLAAMLAHDHEHRLEMAALWAALQVAPPPAG